MAHRRAVSGECDPDGGRILDWGKAVRPAESSDPGQNLPSALLAFQASAPSGKTIRYSPIARNLFDASPQSTVLRAAADESSSKAGNEVGRVRVCAAGV